MARVFISLGSNLGDRLQYLQRAIDALTVLPATNVKGASSVYETEPFGKTDQPEFYNAVAELTTTLEPLKLFRELKDIERTLGRTKSERWGPREIDLDILYYDVKVVGTAELTIPHPGRQSRRFVLEPLSEIAGEHVDPVTRQTVNQLLDACPDKSAVKKTLLKLTIANRKS